MDFSTRLADLEKRVKDLEASVSAAASESREQVQRRIDQAESDTQKALQTAQQQASAAGERAQDSWSKLKADAAARHAEVKGKDRSTWPADGRPGDRSRRGMGGG